LGTGKPKRKGEELNNQNALVFFEKEARKGKGTHNRKALWFFWKWVKSKGKEREQTTQKHFCLPWITKENFSLFFLLPSPFFLLPSSLFLLPSSLFALLSFGVLRSLTSFA
jgi:hypothetical protein